MRVVCARNRRSRRGLVAFALLCFVSRPCAAAFLLLLLFFLLSFSLLFFGAGLDALVSKLYVLSAGKTSFCTVLLPSRNVLFFGPSVR